MEIRIFYSWQSDLPNNTNRSFIETALNNAVKKIRSDESIKVEPRTDKDTQGVGGSPAIPETILHKIDEADIFVCDVSIINNKSKFRLSPNPNVLFELGYALKKHSWDRVIMVCNEAYGNINKLPFDLPTRRIDSYTISEKDNDKATERKKLEGILKSRIQVIIEKFALEDRNRAKGIPLIKVARIAIEEGDFNTVLEAFMSVLRLAYTHGNRMRTTISDEREGEQLKNELVVHRPSSAKYPVASIDNSALEILKMMAQTDNNLFTSAIMKATEYGFWGDIDFSSFNGYDSLPADSFGAVFTILVKSCHYFSSQGITWAEKCIAESLGQALIGLGYVTNERGTELPEPPERLIMVPTGDRWISDEQHRDLLPLVSLAHAVAILPESSFIYALSRFKYFTTGFDIKGQISSNGNELPKLMKSLNYHAANQHPGYMIIHSFKNKKDMEIFNKHHKEIKKRGYDVNEKLVRYIIKENELAVKNKIRI